MCAPRPTVELFISLSLSLSLGLVLSTAGCGTTDEPVDSGTAVDTGVGGDGALPDSGAADSGGFDSALPDDGGLDDTGPGDAGDLDAGEMDAGATDAGEPDGGTADGGAMDGAAGDGATDGGTTPDAALDAAPDAAPDAGMCSFVRDFTVMPGGGAPFVWRFNADGTWVFAMTAAGLPTSPNTGTWMQVGARIEVIDDFLCAPGMGAGLYDVVWDATCTSFTLTVFDDTCAGRASSLDGLVYTAI